MFMLYFILYFILYFMLYFILYIIRLWVCTIYDFGLSGLGWCGAQNDVLSCIYMLYLPFESNVLVHLM